MLDNAATPDKIVNEFALSVTNNTKDFGVTPEVTIPTAVVEAYTLNPAKNVTFRLMTIV